MLTTILCTTALAFETIICNCDNPAAKEDLRTNDENCPLLLKPTQKKSRLHGKTEELEFNSNRQSAKDG
ncbi:Uncharacterized protein APZ42_005498 [Daphnia magna]|uniref:Uncharacterized protein n=1 Tax=Daphnia magna TaxID=35525 RepID=A0A164GEW0_9CRUS|nr:Uncharacterized protein APZ42_005498 [Daphnia magna]